MSEFRRAFIHRPGIVLASLLATRPLSTEAGTVLFLSPGDGATIAGALAAGGVIVGDPEAGVLVLVDEDMPPGRWRWTTVQGALLLLGTDRPHLVQDATWAEHRLSPLQAVAWAEHLEGD